MAEGEAAVKTTKEEDIEAVASSLRALQLQVGKQGDTVRALKSDVKAGSATQEQVTEAIAKLAEIKQQIEQQLKHYAELSGDTANSDLDKEAFRQSVTEALNRRLFFIPSYKIYNGVGGLYDYGPPGSAVKTNLLNVWRQHFVIEENMLEIECPSVTPEIVLKTSGHVEKFTDFMVRDEKTLDCIRADHLLKDWIEKKLKTDPMILPEEREAMKDVLARVDEFDAEELGTMLKKYGVRSPETGNAVTDPFPFNLMFETSIGPTGTLKGYLRPETAQGIFVNFRDLLYYNGGKLPFAAAQVGQAFRNEISPKAGLLRVREFTLAEIEHFVNPEDKSHPRFDEIADVELQFFGREEQLGKERMPVVMRMADAVSSGKVNNQTLGYFIARVYLFLMKVGIDKQRLRFRQHLLHEMAHYACDCWDAEIESSYGWIECVGIADRSAYDLKAHMDASKVDLVAYEKYDEPKLVEAVEVTPDNKTLGKQFKKDAKIIKEALAALTEDEAMQFKATMDSDGVAPLTICTTGQTFELSKENVTITKETKKVQGYNYIPGVIEPSFGIGRILYSIFEHSFYTREDDAQKTVFSFSPVIAPIKCTVFPLLSNKDMMAVAQKIQKALGQAGISNKIDTTGISIGKRYARTDEIGVPFAVTVDHTSLEDNTVTLRERDSTAQIRLPIENVPSFVTKLVVGTATWADAKEEFPAV